MSLLESAAADYARHRPGIPDAVVRLPADALEGIGRPLLLSLGAGTGRVPSALLPAVPRMARLDLVVLDEGVLRGASARLPSVLPDGGATAFHPLLAEELTAPHSGCGAHPVTCAPAFHRMSRPSVLTMADRVTAPAAAVAVTGDGSPWTRPTPWKREWKQLAQTCLGQERRAGTAGPYAAPGRRHEDDLRESAFSDITVHRFPLHRTRTPAGVVGHLRGTSFARPASFGGQHARFGQGAHALPEEQARHAGLVEDTVVAVLLARRPGAGR
ncbi:MULTISPECIES: methyltransferase [Streptomyces]|uniref:Methyltransferase n=1 Tax=Streptomyces fimbriatus TaxID=68197 RepID=A0ABW0DKP3_STRFI